MDEWGTDFHEALCMRHVALDVTTSPWWWLKLQRMTVGAVERVVACGRRKKQGGTKSLKGSKRGWRGVRGEKIWRQFEKNIGTRRRAWGKTWVETVLAWEWEPAENRVRGNGVKKKGLRNHERVEFNLKETKIELQWSWRDGMRKQEEGAVSWSLKFFIRREIFRYGHYGFSFLFFMFLLFHSLWFSHFLLGSYGLVIIGLIFYFLFYSNQEILECASVCCFIFKELAGFYALFWKPFPQLNPLIVKPMNKITKWVQHID